MVCRRSAVRPNLNYLILTKYKEFFCSAHQARFYIRLDYTLFRMCVHLSTSRRFVFEGPLVYLPPLELPVVRREGRDCVYRRKSEREKDTSDKGRSCKSLRWPIRRVECTGGIRELRTC